jgi:cobaltochelatase CobT
LQGVVTKLANRLQRRLMAQQNRSWDFDQEEGLLDAARLARVVVSPGSSLSYKVERDVEFKDTVVTLLIDNSGSMRGRPDLDRGDQRRHSGAHARTLRRQDRNPGLHHPRLEGRAEPRGLAGRRQAAGIPAASTTCATSSTRRPTSPGGARKRNLGLMMREGLLKENIDGEALLWAHNRLHRAARRPPILMVISDGAPVDDSTLSVNSAGNYLEAHLRRVIDGSRAGRSRSNWSPSASATT